MQKKELPSLYLQSPKLNQLNILREIAADAHITQAELATRCSLSVAMVNNYMKELCRIGLMEYHRRTIKSVTYHLTSAGLAQLEVLQRELIREMTEMYIASKEHVIERIRRQAPAGMQRVILFGGGHSGQLAFHALELANVNIIGVCNDDMELIGSDFCGREVISPSQMRFLSPDAVILAETPRTEEVSRGLEYLSDQGIIIIHMDGKAVSRSAGTGESISPSIPACGSGDAKATLPSLRSIHR